MAINLEELRTVGLLFKKTFPIKNFRVSIMIDRKGSPIPLNPTSITPVNKTKKTYELDMPGMAMTVNVPYLKFDAMELKFSGIAITDEIASVSLKQGVHTFLFACINDVIDNEMVISQANASFRIEGMVSSTDYSEIAIGERATVDLVVQVTNFLDNTSTGQKLTNINALDSSQTVIAGQEVGVQESSFLKEYTGT